MFWNADVKRGNQASARCVHIAAQILATARNLKEQAPQEKVGKVMEVMLSFNFASEGQRTAETIGFITGGYDTTGYTLAWALFELADHPNVQAALAKDLLLDSQPQRLTHVVNEAMRLWPVVAGGGTRVASRDFVCSNGMIIPKGAHWTNKAPHLMLGSTRNNPQNTTLAPFPPETCS